MAETGALLRGRFAGVDLDALVDWRGVRTWLYWGMFWLLVAPSVGRGPVGPVQLPRLSRHPSADNVRQAAAGPRQRRDLWRVFLALHWRMLLSGAPAVRRAGAMVAVDVPLAWLWNITTAAALISLLFGENHGLEAGEFPLFAKIPIFVVCAVATAQFLMTISRRLEPPLYVALWYLIGAFVWTTMNLVLGILLPYMITGINSAAFHGLYIHYIVGLWLTPAGYVLIYYFLPISVRNPIYAHKLSLVGFWSLALFYPFVGIHHYLYSPIADWAETIAIVTSMLLIIPVWTVLVNFFGTVMGRWDGFGQEPAREVPDHGRDHVPLRLLPGIDGGAAPDSAADPFHRLRHFAFPPHGVRHLRGVGDGRAALRLAARMRTRALVVQDGQLGLLVDHGRHLHHGARPDGRRPEPGLPMDGGHRVARFDAVDEAVLVPAHRSRRQHGHRDDAPRHQSDADRAHTAGTRARNAEASVSPPLQPVEPRNERPLRRPGRGHLLLLRGPDHPGLPAFLRAVRANHQCQLGRPHGSRPAEMDDHRRDRLHAAAAARSRRLSARRLLVLPFTIRAPGNRRDAPLGSGGRVRASSPTTCRTCSARGASARICCASA